MTMPTPYLSQQPVDDFGLRQSNIIYYVDLPSGVEVVMDVPADARRYKAIITNSGSVAASPVWMALNATATIPSLPTFVQSDSVAIPPGAKICREVVSGDAIHCIAPDVGTQVSIELFSLGTLN